MRGQAWTTPRVCSACTRILGCTLPAAHTCRSQGAPVGHALPCAPGSGGGQVGGAPGTTPGSGHS